MSLLRYVSVWTGADVASHNAADGYRAAGRAIATADAVGSTASLRSSNTGHGVHNLWELRIFLRGNKTGITHLYSRKRCMFMQGSV